MIAKKKLSVAFLPLVATASVLSGCELAYKKQVAAFVNENIQECNGKLEKLALVQDGTNRLTGLAEVSVDGEEYKTTLTVKTGLEDAIITMDDNICAMHSVRTGIKALQNLFE
jgi:hypothetical protein